MSEFTQKQKLPLKTQKLHFLQSLYFFLHHGVTVSMGYHKLKTAVVLHSVIALIENLETQYNSKTLQSQHLL